MVIKVVGRKTTAPLDQPLAKSNYSAEALRHSLDQF